MLKCGRCGNREVKLVQNNDLFTGVYCSICNLVTRWYKKFPENTPEKKKKGVVSMKPTIKQIRKEMESDFNATKYEIESALHVYSVLEPALKFNANGRINTSYGDKTVLGLYRVLQTLF